MIKSLGMAFLSMLEEPGKVVTDFQDLIGDVDILSASG